MQDILNNSSLIDLVDGNLCDHTRFTRFVQLMSASVIDYVVTHVRERLPEMVVALGQHESWETLAPAVFGVSLDEFERGWREHVAELVQ